MLIDSLVETTSYHVQLGMRGNLPARMQFLGLRVLGIPMFDPKIQGRWEDFCRLWDMDLGGTPLNMYFGSAEGVFQGLG